MLKGTFYEVQKVKACRIQRFHFDVSVLTIKFLNFELTMPAYAVYLHK